MIKAVSSVNYSPAFKSTATDFAREGKYSSNPAQEEFPTAGEEPRHTGRKIAKTLLTLVVAAGALFGLYKGNVIKVNPEAKGLSKISHWLAKGGEFVNNKVYEPLAKFFSGKGKKVAEAAEKAAETVKEAAGKTAEKVAEAAEKVAENIAK